ncbi:MAG: tRNA (guanine-N7-)-methyltransferase [Actinomycetota bacterium]|jgi:tRNA (guanine-N7-)-methyltransferase|nr:tRNA (guanine-N7-)-methyltransferase [Actinomycetota bacterium]
MTVRSYRHRRGRMGTTTAAALERLGDQIVQTDGRVLDAAALFGRRAPLIVEIGSGMGEATAEMAAADPTRDLLAVDVHLQGLGRLLRRVEELGLTNVRVAEGDGVVLLRDMLAGAAVDEVRVFFPDPWPKARHAKRRLVQNAFLDVVATRLRPGGRLHLATDWAPYGEQMQVLVAAHPAYEIEHEGPRPSHRPVTRFEQQGLDAGRTSYDLIARRPP